jgi:hypothetical protein
MLDAVLFMAIRDLIQNNSIAREEIKEILKKYAAPSKYNYSGAQKEYLNYFKG